MTSNRLSFIGIHHYLQSVVCSGAANWLSDHLTSSSEEIAIDLKIVARAVSSLKNRCDFDIITTIARNSATD